MHELSIAQNLLAIIQEEMHKHGTPRLISVKVKHGRLSAIVPEALEMAFEALTIDSPLAGARLDTEEVPLVLSCRACGKQFSPESTDYVFAPCPQCGEEIGHTVVSGKELYIEYLELDEAQGT
ncbi:MAG: hydrogenase maturation nickel metallochaperone HypA [Thermodesulfobacteriota bacterium]